MRCRQLVSTVGVALAVMMCGWSARAATITVAPGDSYTKIEAATAGDEVVIMPGTYKFRVHLTKQGTTSKPIVIRAQDPANPPVWDLHETLVENAPGSYTAGDRGRGCWQLSGATNVRISGLVITGCHNAGANSSGVRYYNGARGIVLSDIVFRDNDNGLTGGTGDSEATAEFCEFDRNGNLKASSNAPTHNIYIFSGTFTLRYSYLHDPIQGQNFHVRAKQSTLEYNWITRAKSYAGDLMTDDETSGGTQAQTMTLRGNVIVQGDGQANSSQVIAVYNDSEASNLTLNVKAFYNTFIGPSANGRAGFIHLYDESGATTMNAEVSNNIIYRTTRPVYVENSKGKVTGTNNWLSTGADATGLTGSLTGSDPKFKNAAQNDFTLAAGSPAIGAASTSVGGPPDREYYRDETTNRQYRARAAAADLGAFESATSSAPIGPYGTPLPTGAGGSSGAAGSTGAAGTTGTAGSTGTGGRGGSSAGRGGATGNAGSQGVAGSLGAAGTPGVAGAPGVAGTTGAAGAATVGAGGSATAPAGSSGCSCAVAAPGGPTALGLGALALALARRRRATATRR